MLPIGMMAPSRSRYYVMIHPLVRLVAASLLVAACAVRAADLPTRTLTIDGNAFTVEVAATPETRERGLMNRFSLQPDHGMLFVFESPQPLAFWMKNTYVALSIAFVAANGRILNIEDMRPQDESPHWSKGPALYAIEMRKGWFAAKGIAPGDRVEGLVAR